MIPLNIIFIYYNISQYLTLKDTIILSMTCKDLHKLANNEDILKINYFKYNNLIIKYKDYLRMSFLKNSRSICGICNKPIIFNVILSFHYCNILKKCVRCNNNECECDKTVYYHKQCINYENHFFKCPLCNQLALGFELRINI